MEYSPPTRAIETFYQECIDKGWQSEAIIAYLCVNLAKIADLELQSAKGEQAITQNTEPINNSQIQSEIDDVMELGIDELKMLNKHTLTYYLRYAWDNYQRQRQLSEQIGQDCNIFTQILIKMANEFDRLNDANYGPASYKTSWASIMAIFNDTDIESKLSKYL